MTTRRAHAPRNARIPAHTTSLPSPRLLSSHTFTLIASWRGQLLICIVVLVVGAIYFVVREPVRRWRRRQRERLSRALTAELLSMEKQDSRGGQCDEKDQLASSKCLSTAITTPKRARERGREKRKEAKEAKKRVDLLRVDSKASSVDTTSIPTSSTRSSSPVSGSTNWITDPSASAKDTGGPSHTSSSSSPQSQLTTASSTYPIPPTITLDSIPSDKDVPSSSQSPSTRATRPPTTTTESPESAPLPLPSPREIDLSTDGEENPSPRLSAEASDRQANSNSRSAHSSHQSSSTYSIIPDESYLPVLPGAKKKGKRKSKARGGGEVPRSPQITRQPSLSALRNLNMSSDDGSSPRSVSATLSSTPGSPSTPRRRRQTSVAGVPMTPALDLLLTNHERTIDHLRAEIGVAKAEESKARDDEVRAREELRRSRATEDRMRSDYERARKARDRAENETRRIENEILVMRSRFEGLYHMYCAVATRMRELEATVAAQAASSNQDGNGSSQVPPTPSQYPPPSPFLPFPTPGGIQMGCMPYGNSPVYGSPIVAHGFPLQLPVSPSPLRRTDGASSSDLAGPLTPGQGPSSGAHSQLGSPYPPELSINTSFTSVPSSSSGGASDSAQMSSVELRRLHIASSVLKKKTPTSDSGDSNPTSTRASEPADKPAQNSNPMAGLGISQLTDVESTFPSANGHSPRPTTSKQASLSSSVASSDGSSAAPGRQILITPSNADVYHPSSNTTESSEDRHVFVREPDSVHQSTEGDAPDTPDEACIKPDNIPCHKSIDNVNDQDASTDSGQTEYVPMFASLAHTPEQLAEIARMRESAIRNRERRTTSQQKRNTESEL